MLSAVKNLIFWILIFILYFSFISDEIYPQIYSEKDVEICNAKFRFAVERILFKKPIGDVIVEIGKSFLGTNYQASTLEKDGDEQLVINFTGLDCTTFLETSLALARCVKSGDTSFIDFQKEITKIRYRDGIINKYPSRLHYFSDWIYDNQRKGIIKDITKESGGEPVQFNVNFMSSHPQSYKHLKENPEFIPLIKEHETKINEREYFYIPKEKTFQAEEEISNGDLIAIVTNIKGLDISHTGIAVKKDDGRIYLIHAPSEGSKVQITQNTLPDYLKKINNHKGIIVLRVEKPSIPD